MRKILLVDDDADTLRTLRDAMENHGFHVTAVQDASEAMENLKAGQFDVLVTDGYMVDYTGYELAITADETQANIKKILISGFYEQEDVSRALFSRHLKKPVEIPELLVALGTEEPSPRKNSRV